MATQVKTLRLPEDVVALIEQFPGDSFSGKFISAARLLGRDREVLEKQLRDLEQERAKQYAALADMDKLLRKRDGIQRTLDDVSWRLSEASRMCKNMESILAHWPPQDTSNKDT